MDKIWIIAKRELSSYFDSLIAYIMIILFLGFSGFFTWLYGNTVFLVGQADLRAFFNISYWTLFLFIPAITMRSLAEEKRSGTIELLSSKPVSNWEIVAGKFLSCFMLIGITLAFTLPFYLTVSLIGKIDHGGTIGGYLGLLMLSSAYIGIGVFASSTTDNQIVALLLSLLIGIFFHLLFGVMSYSFSGTIGDLLGYLNARNHFDSLSRGVIDSRDIIYFASLTFVGLLLAQSMLSKRSWAK